MSKSKYTREELEKTYQECKGIPRSDYSNLDKFLKTTKQDDIAEIVDLLKMSASPINTEEVDDFLKHILGLIFINEFEVDEFSHDDFIALRNQFQRQLMAEYLHRLGQWDISQEKRVLIVDNEEF